MNQKAYGFNRLMWMVVIIIVAVVMISACSREPDIEQIKSDLIGQKISSPLFRQYWYVESLSEFKTFQITNKTKQSDILEFDVAIDLEGIRTKAPGTIAKVVYKKTDGKWKLASVSAVSLKPTRKVSK